MDLYHFIDPYLGVSGLDHNLIRTGKTVYESMMKGLFGVALTVAIARSAWSLVSGEGAVGAIQSINGMFQFSILGAAFPTVLGTIVTEVSHLAEAFVGRGTFHVSPADLSGELNFDVWSVKAWIQFTTFASLGLIHTITEAIHSVLLLLVFAFAPIVIFSSTLFRFTMGTQHLISLALVSSLWPLGSAVISKLAGALAESTNYNVGEGNVIALFGYAVVFILLQLLVPWILLRMSGMGLAGGAARGATSFLRRSKETIKGTSAGLKSAANATNTVKAGSVPAVARAAQAAGEAGATYSKSGMKGLGIGAAKAMARPLVTRGRAVGAAYQAYRSPDPIEEVSQVIGSQSESAIQPEGKAHRMASAGAAYHRTVRSALNRPKRRVMR